LVAPNGEDKPETVVGMKLAPGTIWVPGTKFYQCGECGNETGLSPHGQAQIAQGSDLICTECWAKLPWHEKGIIEIRPEQREVLRGLGLTDERIDAAVDRAMRELGGSQKP
jgi:DNA-directed RNA polymerase subunit RPC12/RpoP